MTHNGAKALAVMGEATGTHFKQRTWQVAFGENPGAGNWQTIQTSNGQIEDGVLGEISRRFLNRQGVWSIRSSVTDEKGATRFSLTTVKIE